MKAINQHLDQYLTIETVSNLLSVSRGTIYNLIRQKKLRKTKITEDLTRIKASDVQAYLDSRTK